MLNTVNLFIALVVAAITYGTPLLFGTLGEVLTEKSGSLNLGVEGMMIVGAFAGFLVLHLSGSPWLGLLAAGCAAALLGMLHGPSGPCSRPQKDAFYARRDAFTEAFAKAHGSLQCRGVLGHDLATPEGMAAVKQNNLFIKTCAPLVCHTCALLEEYL